MAYATQISTAQQHGFAARLRNLIKDVSDALAQRKSYRRALAELGSLSNSELAELGLTRGELSRVTYQAVYKA